MQEKAVKIDVSLLEKVFRTIVSFGILVAAFLLAMDCANAESLPNYVINHIEEEDVLQTLKNTNSDVLDAYNRALNLGYYLKSEGNRYNSRQIYYIFTDYDKLRFGTTTSSSSYYAYPAYLFNSSDTIYAENNQGFTLHMIAFSCYNDGNGNYRLNFVRESYYTFNIGSHVNNSWNTNLIYNYTTQYTNPEYNYPRSSQGCIAYGEFYGLNGSSTNSGIAFKVDEFEAPPSTNTDGLVVYKQSIHNNEYLLIDFSKCVDWSLATNSDYYLGESSFTLDIDGTQETIELDEETYYTYNVNTKKAYFQIPVSFFNAYGYENAVNVFATNISINYGIVVGMPINFEAHYIDNVWLKRAADIDFEPSDYQKEAEITYQDNISYVEEYNDYIVYNDSSFSMEYNIDQPLYASVDSALASINGTAKTFTIEAWYDSEDTDKVYFLPLETTTSDRVILWDFLIDNPYALYCDVLVVNVKRYTLPTSYNSNTPWEYTHSVGAMVIYTQRYYLRNMSNAVITSLVDVVEYDKTVAQYTYWLYDLAYDKLTNMDENMAAYFTSDLQILNDVLIKLDSINNIVPNLEDILNNILDALQNLDLDMPETDLSGISSQLATIITKLDTIANNTSSGNINNDWYKRYRNWLYDETNDNVLNTPHEYMLNTFDDVKALFDVFAYFDLPQTGFWSSAREYLNRMNGNTYNDNINDYLVTGIGSQNFYKDNCNTLVWSDIE